MTDNDDAIPAAAAAAAAAATTGGGGPEARQPVVRACIYCAPSIGLKVHPYVPHDFNDRKVWFYGACHQNWRTYRESMEKAGELMLEGEPNEVSCGCVVF